MVLFSFSGPIIHGADSPPREPGELKLKLLAFQGKKSHSLRIKLNWAGGTALGDNTWAVRVKGEGEDSNGKFNYMVTRVSNPEWTDYIVWINYNTGKHKNQTLSLNWVTHGHEPPDNSTVADGTWSYNGKRGKLTGSSE